MRLDSSLLCLAVTMCIYVNRDCRCGGLLLPHRVGLLEQKIGAHSVRSAVEMSVQELVNCSAEPGAVFRYLPEGDGQIFIKGTPAIKC